MDEVTKRRLALLRKGIRPVLCDGKRPVLDDWPNLRPTEEQIIAWARDYPAAKSTGINGRDFAGLDIDIRHPEAATACEETVREWIEDRGTLLVRFGNRPKRLIPFCFDAPFPKIVRVLKDANGETHRIEMLCDGQQWIDDGFNKDANAAYSWHAGRDLINTDGVPATDADDAEKLVDHLVDILVEQFGFIDVTGESGRINGAGNGHGSSEPFDPEAALAAMLPDEASVEDVQRRVALSWMQQGKHPDEILDRLVARTMEVAKAGGLPWNHKEEVTAVTSRIINRFRLLTRDYKTELPPWLPGEFHVDYMDNVSQGLTSTLGRNAHGFYIRRAEQRPRNGHAAPNSRLDDAGDLKPDVSPTATSVGGSAEDPKTERRLRFKLIAFRDMRPGLEPVYLVDELIPSAGLVLVWGRQKTYKSFWLLDLMLHVAKGWPYRDRAVRQGAVIYCAFEGAHGYKGRCEAQRRHYNVHCDEDVPLYVMPGQVDLIKDEATLVAEFRLQLGDIKPAIVVLDTLNRSLKGSENSDEDMTKYTRAAEAIRQAFGCVVIIVHHCGYDSSHSRGHTSLPAAVDAELEVAREPGSPMFLVTVKNMRDGPEGTVVRSRAETIRLDVDQEGRPRSSIVVVPDDSPVDPGNRGGRPDSAYPTFLSAMRLALAEDGITFTPDDKLPLQAVAEQHVRKRFYRTYIDGEDDKKKSDEAQKSAFRRAMRKAIEGKIVTGQKSNQGTPMLWWVGSERRVETPDGPKPSESFDTCFDPSNRG